MHFIFLVLFWLVVVVVEEVEGVPGGDAGRGARLLLLLFLLHHQIIPMAMTMNMSPALKRRSHTLSLDLSDLPQLSQPSPASNTLIITNLADVSIFTAANLESIQQAITAHAPTHSFCPLRSMRRIIVSFYTIEDAVAVRQLLDGETVLGNRVRVYFGANTKVDLTEDQHLQAPKSQRLFFISPPPSPPVGWTMRNEEPPNKEVHADDLASALAKLHARPAADDALYENMDSGAQTQRSPVNRQRSGTTGSMVVYDPQEHGKSPDLPAIAVEDTTESPLPLSPMEGVEKKFPHTARPPVELM